MYEKASDISSCETIDRPRVLILESCTGQRQKYAVVIEREKSVFYARHATDAISFMRRQWHADLAARFKRRFNEYRENLYVTGNNICYNYKFFL